MAINFFKKIKKVNQNKKGFGIIEMLVVIFLVVVGLNSLLGFSSFSLNISNLTKQTTQANKLALEAVRNFRDGTTWNVNGLGTLTNGTIYHIQKTTDVPPKWQLVTGEETIDNFKRKIVFGEVFRNSSTDDIADSGDQDTNTKKVTVTITWQNESVELVTYLTN